MTQQAITQAKGRPMLHWAGKKPIDGIEYYPAQEKEVYGNEVDHTWNGLYWGDNLQVLSHLLKEYRGKIDLIYIDPPFDSKADYARKVKVRGKKVRGQPQSLLEEKQYTDIWENDEYLQFMYERLLIMRELLSEKGSFFLHCDWRKVHHLRALMDEVFGEGNLRNEIVWVCGRMGEAHRSLPTSHNTILHYSKSNDWTWNAPRVPYSQSLIKSLKKDDKGWYYTRGKMGREMAAWEVEQGVGLKSYVDPERGKQAEDVWDDVGNYSAGEYPTQKPTKLLDRIIQASSNEGDLVADFFVGSGTTVVSAQQLGRRWLACDINLGAIQITTKRVNRLLTDKKNKHNTGFKVFNVNDYDVFKNELEAKAIVMDTYGVEPIKLSYFDGVLDNHFVKVMPLNRVLNKLDIKNVLKSIEEKIDAFTVKPSSKAGDTIYEQGVIVICSGKELDVEDYLKTENKTGVRVEIRDLQTDKQNLTFKKPPEANIEVKKNGKTLSVVIKDFYSPMLMQKLELENAKALSVEQQASVDDYHQIIDSVAIDVDYDGKLFNAEIMDLPTKQAVVAGSYTWEYKKPEYTTVAVKVVDVLGEEYFETFKV